MSPTARAAARRLTGTVIAAVATPMTAAGELHAGALERYAARLAASGLGGFAVWAHTGRGLHLSEADRTRVLDTFRAASDGFLVAGAGVPDDADARTPEEQIAAAARMARRAEELGADCVMVYPCPAFRDAADRDALVLRLHEAVAAAADLPLIGFWLHGAAGGYPYSWRTVTQLMEMPAMCGMKLATLDRAIDCQDAIAAIRAGGRLAVTGEDRMFGPSLMWGAGSALVGIAAAVPRLSVDLVDRWTANDATGFLACSSAMDRFAEVTFREPIEGYVQRMLWAASWEGLIPDEAAHDPWVPPELKPDERRQVEERLEEIVPGRSW